ncbi:YoaK family protein [Antricoccus suffuscus]|uniref:YoaK family protein n=1 Tax=Antricoccus suffuscus TaxID=1629062 RepID=UPI00192D41D0|nr:YoaK family protein [Antricoccus suffuscus]
MKSHLAGVPTDSAHLALMLLLTFSTGIVDAVGFLGLDRVFAGNMTGNVVVLGMGLLGAGGFPVVGPLIAFFGFFLGATIAGRSLRKAQSGWSNRLSLLFGTIGLLILVLAATLLIVGDHPSSTVQVITTSLLGCAMGAQAGAARFIAVKDVTTVVITSTITALASELALGSGGDGRGLRRVAAIALMLSGAALGATLLRWHLGAGLCASGAITLVVAFVGAVHFRSNKRAEPNQR